MAPSGCPVTPGFPIRRSPDQCAFDHSPGHIAAYHVLLRLSTPRHPPCTLSSLTTLMRGRQRPIARPPSESSRLSTLKIKIREPRLSGSAPQPTPGSPGSVCGASGPTWPRNRTGGISFPHTQSAEPQARDPTASQEHRTTRGARAQQICVRLFDCQRAPQHCAASPAADAASNSLA